MYFTKLLRIVRENETLFMEKVKDLETKLATKFL